MAVPLSTPHASTSQGPAPLTRPALPRSGKEHLVGAWDRWRERRAERWRWQPPDTESELEVSGPAGFAPVALVVAAGVVGALVVIGGLLGWSQWSSRSSPAVESLLPVAVRAEVAEAPDDVGVASGSTGERQVAAPVDGPRVGSDPGEVVVAEPVIVHVAGAVAQPGVVEVNAGDRVIDAVTAVGGPGPDADLDRVNLAAMVVDGQHLVVPAVGEPAVTLASQPGPSAGSAPGTADAQPTVIDLNNASSAELELLPGVGPATATAILRFREERGGFFAVKELLDVPGIGPAKFAAVEAQVMVG